MSYSCLGLPYAVLWCTLSLDVDSWRAVVVFSVLGKIVIARESGLLYVTSRDVLVFFGPLFVSLWGTVMVSSLARHLFSVENCFSWSLGGQRVAYNLGPFSRS